MDPKNLSQLDPKLREAYERVMGTVGTPQQHSADPPADPKPSDPPPATPPTPNADPPNDPPQQHMAATPAFQAHATLNPQPNPVEPPPSLGAVPSASGIEAKPAPPSEFAVDVPPPPPPPPGLEPNPPQQAEATQTVTFSNPSAPQAQNANSSNETLVQTAVKPSSNKIMPVMIALALVVFFLVWAFLWITILGLKF